MISSVIKTSIMVQIRAQISISIDCPDNMSKCLTSATPMFEMFISVSLRLLTQSSDYNLITMLIIM